MCCFTRPVTSVSRTSIFARDAEPGRQYLAYQMHYRADEELAMVLPLPVPAGTGEEAVHFIDLHEYPSFFEDLEKGCEPPPSRVIGALPVSAAAAPPLAVQRVGSFEASFVPTVKDFDRLDERFRMPAGVWDKLTGYASYGFAVFKLRKEARSVHPMAFSFPREGKQLFFPTVHVHDGQVHAKAHFDHDLYCQVGEQHGRARGWDESPGAAGSFMRVRRSHGLIDPKSHCYRKTLHGTRDNADIRV